MALSQDRVQRCFVGHITSVCKVFPQGRVLQRFVELIFKEICKVFLLNRVQQLFIELIFTEIFKALSQGGFTSGLWS